MKPETLAKFQKMKEDYSTMLPAKLDSILTHYKRILESKNNGNQFQEELREFYSLVHNLAGSGASFGYPEISEIARGLEIVVKKIQDNNGLSKDWDNDMQAKLNELQSIIK